MHPVPVERSASPAYAGVPEWDSSGPSCLPTDQDLLETRGPRLTIRDVSHVTRSTPGRAAVSAVRRSFARSFRFVCFRFVLPFQTTQFILPRRKMLQCGCNEKRRVATVLVVHVFGAVDSSALRHSVSLRLVAPFVHVIPASDAAAERDF